MCVDIYEKYIVGDLVGSLKVQFNLAPLRSAFTIGTLPAVIKEVLTLLGIEASPCMAPAEAMTKEERQKLYQVFIGMRLLN